MDNKKLILGGLAGGAAFFLLGWIFYGMLMKNYFEANSSPGVYKEIPDFPILILGNLAMGFLFSVVLGLWSKASSPSEGAKKGFLFALLLGAGYDLMMYSTSTIMTMPGMIGDILVTVVMGTIVGAIVTMVMSSKRKAVA